MQPKNAQCKDQMFRIVKGQIGPSNLTKEEAIQMMHTIQNRMVHKDINSKLTCSDEYHTLRYPEQDYNLTPSQMQILESAWREKDSTPNKGKVGWATGRDTIPSNQWYEWKADEQKMGQHYYYDAKPRA